MLEDSVLKTLRILYCAVDCTATTAAWQSSSIWTLQTTILQHPLAFTFSDSHYDAFPFGKFCADFER